MKLDKKLAQGLTVILGLYLLFTYSLGATLVTFGVAAIILGFTHSVEAVLVVLSAPIVIQVANELMKPPANPMEGFQARDAPSIHQRIETVRMPAQPKVASPAGVLESANILDSAPLKDMNVLASEALPGSSIPASAKARVAIYTPEESTVPSTGVREYMPFANPVLQNGPDTAGVANALVPTGAAPGPSSPADVIGITGGSENAY
jgi:hypothetical protein